MLLTKVVVWADIAANKDAWSVLVWFATLVALADGLSTVGFLKWFAERAGSLVTEAPVMVVVGGAVALYFLVHYLFASITAQTAALMSVFLLAVISVPGVPAKPVAMLLCYCHGLMGIISPYATGPAPIWYGSGYVSTKDFWKLGAITGAIFLAVLLGVGIPYTLTFMR
jgi:L-tartrate/succinate antiporter